MYQLIAQNGHGKEYLAVLYAPNDQAAKASYRSMMDLLSAANIHSAKLLNPKGEDVLQYGVY